MKLKHDSADEGGVEDDMAERTTSAQWLTADEAAMILRVHVTTVHEMCRRGELPAMKAGRDWRISASGLQQKADLGDVHNKLIQETAELSATKAASRVLGSFADALMREVARQQHPSTTVG